MLFHVSLTHDGAHCPGWHPELMPKVLEAWEKREEIAQRHNVKLHSIMTAAPEHLDFLIAEAESPASVAMLLSEFWPIEAAAIDVKAVTIIDDQALALFKQIMGQMAAS
ncbi:MAG TPA: hypothetical protein VJ256_04080 [Dehalococcoidia bacterium]|nr:hypothetical protein [Dehalococcoidia bacterium]HLB28775.1 hypothetical protein [Dehalococcoidia bacterium]